MEKDGAKTDVLMEGKREVKEKDLGEVKEKQETGSFSIKQERGINGGFTLEKKYWESRKDIK